MNPRSSFIRKISYLAGMVPLLLLLYWLSQPASPESKSGRGAPGGLLVQLRDKYGLSQTHLGEVDPASETIKLATLGMRGVAAVILWEKADKYKMKKDWANLGATLNQIIKVQPNFVSVWRHQGWNLSYNVSAEFDDYRQRYHWVIRGIEFLKEGIKYNEREPMLRWDIGWYTGQKIGRADESKQFRKLFKQDDDFHGSRPLAQRDNWLVGKEWFRNAEALVDAGAQIKATPSVFRSEAPMCQMNYAAFLEKDGIFGEVAKRAWKGAAEEWNQLGLFDFLTSDGVVIHLNDMELHQQVVEDLARKLDVLAPGVRQKMLEEKRAAMSEEQRKALDIPLKQRTRQQQELADSAPARLEIDFDDVARRVTGPNRKEAIKLAKQISDEKDLVRTIKHEREYVNFDHWRLCAEVEQTDEALAAHEWVYKGEQAFALGELVPALQYYERGLAAWRAVLDKFPQLLAEDITGSDLMDVVKGYKNVLEKLDEPFPKDFILQDVVRMHGK